MIFDFREQKLNCHFCARKMQFTAAHRDLFAAHFESLPATPPPSAFPDKSIRTFIRARPLLPNEQGEFPVLSLHPTTQSTTTQFSDRSVGMAVTIGEPTVSVRGTAAARWHRAEVDGAFAFAATNRDVYEVACRELVRAAAGGGLGTVLFYGQTGSGKTYTASGISGYIAEDLFAGISPGWRVAVACVQILGDEVTCLLAAEGAAAVRVLEDVQCDVHLVGATEVPVAGPEEYQRVVGMAFARRTTRATDRNEVSSRSHFVIRVRVSCDGQHDGLLHIIDLAGSERTKDQLLHDPVRKREATLINESLMTLKNCIKSRGEAFSRSSGAHVHIPFRASKVTQILKDSLELTVSRPFYLSTIACLSPLARDANHSVNTTRFATGLMSAPPAHVLGDEDTQGLPWRWDAAALDEWFAEHTSGRVSSSDLGVTASDGGVAGKLAVELPRALFEERVAKKIGKVGAQRLYEKWWEGIVDARAGLKDRIAQGKRGSQENKVVNPKKATAAPRAPASSSSSSSSSTVITMPSVDPLDPIKWKQDEALKWLASLLPSEASKAKAGSIFTSKVQGGLALTRLGRSEFVARVKDMGVAVAKAEEIHAELLRLAADAKKRARAGV